MQYYRAIIKSINATSDNINFDLNVNYYFVSDSVNLRYLRRLVRNVKLSNNSGLGNFAILLNYDPIIGRYNFLDVFPMVVV